MSLLPRPVLILRKRFLLISQDCTLREHTTIEFRLGEKSLRGISNRFRTAVCTTLIGALIRVSKFGVSHDEVRHFVALHAIRFLYSICCFRRFTMPSF